MTVVKEALRSWSLKHLPAEIQVADNMQLRPTSGDAGFRRYYRLDTQPSILAVHAPPGLEDSLAFVLKAEGLRAVGIRVPVILAVDFSAGFLLVEDLGLTHCLDVLDPESFDRVYSLAEDLLLSLQRCSLPPDLLAPYDEHCLRAEFQLFSEWFLGGLLDMTVDAEAILLIRRVEQALVDSALQQPVVPVHRDFHARNLMMMGVRDGADTELGLIDFQDALMGPVTYDLVSLYRDCYIRWPQDRISARVECYLDRVVAEGVIMPVESATFHRWFDLMGLHRHIKVLGIFSRLWLRDGKARYLADLPLVMRYTLEVARCYPEFHEFADWFESAVVPRAMNCPWYTHWETAGEITVEDCV